MEPFSDDVPSLGMSCGTSLGRAALEKGRVGFLIRFADQRCYFRRFDQLSERISSKIFLCRKSPKAQTFAKMKKLDRKQNLDCKDDFRRREWICKLGQTNFRLFLAIFQSGQRSLAIRPTSGSASGQEDSGRPEAGSKVDLALESQKFGSSQELTCSKRGFPSFKIQF